METPDVGSADPDSEEYSQAQFRLYQTIAGRSYSTDNEKTPFDPHTMASKPFPYLNNDWEVTGDQLMAIGYIIKCLKLAQGASVLEFGPGWGNTTLALARNGYNVSAIEIEPNFVDLIREQARRIPVVIDVVQGDFMDSVQLGKSFDCVLFFECFHHCARHNELLDALDQLVSPDGQVAFAAEPITDDFKAPWGLRLDGQSLWAIRKNGWLELGFTESYFVRSLMRRGWLVKKHVLPSCPLGIVYTAHRAIAGRFPMGTFYMAADEDRTWAAPESDPSLEFRYALMDSQITVKSNAAVSSIAIELANMSPCDLVVKLRHGAMYKDVTIRAHSEETASLTTDPKGKVLHVGSALWNPAVSLGSVDDRTIGIGVRSITIS